MTRKAPTMAEQLAAALLGLDYWRAASIAGDNIGLIDQYRIVGYREAKTLTPEQIRARFELDHKPVKVADATLDILASRGIPHVNHHSNLTWEPKAEHRRTTAKVDIPALAKGRRIRRAAASAASQSRTSPQALKEFLKPTPKRKIQSKGFDKTHSKRMDGTVVVRQAD